MICSSTVSTARKKAPVFLLLALAWTLQGLPAVAAQSDSAPSTRQAITLAEPFAAGWAELETKVASLSDSLDQAQGKLALANWLLAVPPAEPASRWLVGFESAGDREVIAECAAEADVQIQQARTLLDQAKAAASQPAADPSDAGRADKLAQSADTLESLAAIMAAAGAEGDEKTVRRTWSRAARGLATLRESSNAELAACARLWQAFGWWRAGQDRRFQASLPSAILPPVQADYDFMSRLLRCRAFGQADQHTTAAALILRVRQSCPEWFSQEAAPAIEGRQKLAGLLEADILRKWLAELKKTNRQAAAGQLETMLADLEKSFSGQNAKAYALPRAIPLLVNVPEPGARPASTTQSSSPEKVAPILAGTQPATRSAD